MEVPTQVNLTRCNTGLMELGTIETLNREDAKQGIGQVWWDIETPLREPKNEPDRHWDWCEIVSYYQNKPQFQAKCVRSSERYIECAMLFRVDALSAFDEGERAIFVDRLATAPRNRQGLAKRPVFRGAGHGLLTYSIALSYSLGFSGRVNLIPVANEDFYTERGFLPTNVTVDEDIVFEIPADQAIGLLQKRGLIDA